MHEPICTSSLAQSPQGVTWQNTANAPGNARVSGATTKLQMPCPQISARTHTLCCFPWHADSSLPCFMTERSRKLYACDQWQSKFERLCSHGQMKLFKGILPTPGWAFIHFRHVQTMITSLGISGQGRALAKCPEQPEATSSLLAPGSEGRFFLPIFHEGRVVSSNRTPTRGPMPLKPAIAAFRSLQHHNPDFTMLQAF